MPLAPSASLSWETTMGGVMRSLPSTRRSMLFPESSSIISTTLSLTDGRRPFLAMKSKTSGLCSCRKIPSAMSFRSCRMYSSARASRSVPLAALLAS